MISAHNDKLSPAMPFSQSPEHCNAVDLRHHQIEQNCRWLETIIRVLELLVARCKGDFITFGFRNSLDELADALLVVDDEQTASRPIHSLPFSLSRAFVPTHSSPFWPMPGFRHLEGKDPPRSSRPT